MLFIFFFFKQRTAYEIRPRDWSSDVCSSDLSHITRPAAPSDILPRCIRCQSFAEPLLELYWHIGDTTTRLGSVGPRIVSGEKRTLAIFDFPQNDARTRENSKTHVVGVHGNDKAADRPEHAIFDAAD